MTRGQLARVFDGIYAGNAWNGTDSLSGPGSGWPATRHIARAIELVVDGTGARSVLNVGCGDDLWTPELPGYLGVDVSARAIARARKHHPGRTYSELDATRDLGVMDAGREERPQLFDLAICRDAIQHLSLEDGQRVVDALAERAAWLLLSTYQDTENEDVDAGAYYSPNLTAAPFGLPAPLLLIPDGFDYDQGDQIRDPRKYLALWRSADIRRG